MAQTDPTKKCPSPRCVLSWRVTCSQCGIKFCHEHLRRHLCSPALVKRLELVQETLPLLPVVQTRFLLSEPVEPVDC